MRTERDGAKENKRSLEEAKNKRVYEAEKSKIKEQESLRSQEKNEKNY